MAKAAKVSVKVRHLTLLDQVCANNNLQSAAQALNYLLDSYPQDVRTKQHKSLQELKRHG